MLRTEIDLGAIFAPVRKRPEIWLVGLGIALRLAEYAQGRSFWIDERSLANNIINQPLFGTPGPLVSDQLAPPGFLLVERLLGQLLGPSHFALRLGPLAAGIAALAAFPTLARRVVDGRGWVVAVALFALSDPLIYFSSELKPYIVDVAVAVLIYRMASSSLLAGPATARKTAMAGAIGAAILPFSFPSAFVLAGVGLPWIAEELRGQRWRGAALASAACAGWLASFAACYVAARQQLGPWTSMWVFWHFAFPPRSFAALTWIPARLANLFANPLQFDTPLGITASAVFGLGLAIIGAIALRKRGWLFSLLAPLALALVASFARLYPFHGRVLLFSVPALILLVAHGLEVVSRRAGRWSRIALIAFVLAVPAALAVEHSTFGRWRDTMPVGDLRTFNPFLEPWEKPLPPKPRGR